jgi:hypothetical protein
MVTIIFIYIEVIIGTRMYIPICLVFSHLPVGVIIGNRKRTNEKKTANEKRRNISHLPNTFPSLSRYYIELVSRYSRFLKNTSTLSFIIYRW